jgi:DNA replication protein DnaC
MAVKESLRKGLKELRLSNMLSECERLKDDPGVKAWSIEEYLEHLVSHELQVRQARAIENRIKAAGFPAIYRLEDYDFRRIPDLDEDLVVELHGCDWIGKGDNLVYSGKHGLGKTHLAISNGVEACEKGFKVLFKKADQLVLELLEARNESQVLKLRARLLRVELLIVDELGYTPFERVGGELLHGILSQRYDARKSVLVTTNLEFGRWVEVFQSKEMTIALLDRLTHRCDVVVMDGKSKRHEESLERQRRRQSKRKEVTKA